MRVVFLIIGLLSRSSWNTLFRISEVAAFVLFRVLGYRRKVIRENLRRSFPEKTGRELAAIRKQFYIHFTDLIVETIKFTACTREEVLSRIVMSEASEQALRRIKKGGVCLLGHRGNWEMANLFISAKNLVEPVVVYKPLASSSFESWFKRLRTRFGSTMVPMKQVYEELEKERDHPYAVYLVNDQSPNPKTAYWTTFLNQDTGVYRGAEIISRKYDAEVFFCDISKIEGRRGCYEVEIIPFTSQPSSFPLNEILERQIRYLESCILKQPHNWLWSHKRWKHPRPAKLTHDQLLEISGEWERTGQSF